MSAIKHVIFLIFFLAAVQAPADSFVFTTWKEFTSPVTTDVKWYFLGGAAVTGFLAVDGVEDSFGHSIQQETIENKPLGRTSHFGDLAGQAIPNAVYALSFYGISYFNDDALAKKRSVHMFKSSAYAIFAATIIKPLAREPRPNGSGHLDSFPSGHTASAFAFASVVGSEHEWYWGVSAYALATFVGYSRINDNAHRFHDVVGGAVLGISYGLSLHYLYTDEKSTIAKFSVAPFSDGVMLGYRTTF